MATQTSLRILARWGALALSTLALCACQSAERSNDLPGLPAAYQNGALDEQPSEDRSVEEHLAQVIRSSRVIDGRRVVSLELQNCSDATLVFAYSVEWLDRAGQHVLDLDAAWTPMALGAGQSQVIELRAPGPAADSWRLMAAALPPQ